MNINSRIIENQWNSKNRQTPNSGICNTFNNQNDFNQTMFSYKIMKFYKLNFLNIVTA